MRVSVLGVKVRLKIIVIKFIKRLLRKFAPSVFIEPMSRAQSSTSTTFSLIVHAIGESRDPVNTVNYLLQSLALSDRDVWLALNELKGRASSNFTMVSERCHHIQSNDIALRLIFSKHISSPGTLSSNEIDSLIDQYELVSDNLKSIQSIRAMLASLVLLKAPLDSVANKLNKLKFAKDSLTDSQKIQFLSRLKVGGGEEDFKRWVDCFDLNSGPAKLKVKQIQGEMFGGGRRIFDQIECDFSELGYDVCDRYKNDLKPVFDSIPEVNDLTWIQYDRDAINGIKRLIVNKVKEKQPLCYIRLGDGECYAFQDDVYVDREGVLRQERHWWGQTLSPKTRERINAEFLASLEHVDILGVPTVTRLVKDFNLIKADCYPINSAISRNMCVMKGMARFLKDKIIIDCQSNLFLFDDGFCKSLFEDAEKVCVVSGINRDLVMKWAPDPSKLECIEIPTHRLLREEGVGTSTSGILPEVYQDYIEDISELAAPGVVFLVSAGFIGKMFIAEASKSGAVALDIGQSLVAKARK